MFSARMTAPDSVLCTPIEGLPPLSLGPNDATLTLVAPRTTSHLHLHTRRTQWTITTASEPSIPTAEHNLIPTKLSPPTSTRRLCLCGPSGFYKRQQRTAPPSPHPSLRHPGGHRRGCARNTRDARATRRSLKIIARQSPTRSPPDTACAPGNPTLSPPLQELPAGLQDP